MQSKQTTWLENAPPSGFCSTAFRSDSAFMACCAPRAVQVCKRPAPSYAWKPCGMWSMMEGPTWPQHAQHAEESLTHVACCAAQHGAMVVVGSTTGRVRMLQMRPKNKARQHGSDDASAEQVGSDATDDEGDCALVCVSLRHDCECAVSDVKVAPAQHGGALCAVAFENGWILLYRINDIPNHPTLDLDNRFHAGNPLEDDACVSMSWRPYSSADVPMMLAACTAQHAAVWWYNKACLAWQKLAVLSDGQASNGTDSNIDEDSNENGGNNNSGGSDIACVCWAPVHGASSELIAIARHCDVQLFALQNDNDKLSVQLEATLTHELPVWKVEWNMLGTMLAASCADEDLDDADHNTAQPSCVVLWCMNLFGDWVRGSVIVGDSNDDDAGTDVAEAAMQDS